MKNNGSDGSSKTTLWFIVGFVVLVTVGFIILAAVSSNSSSSTPSPNFVVTTAPPITSADWTEGSSSSKVTLIEYGDFQCPACGAYFPLVQQIIANNSSSILFVFRNFPLTQVHPDAQMAAQAAEAAGLQGAYWPMHDLLYEDQTTWSAALPTDVVSQYFNGYASSLGLNVTKFDQDINSSQILNKIQTDVSGGNAAAIDHTPTFFINLKQIPNPTSYADFESAVQQAIASSTL